MLHKLLACTAKRPLISQTSVDLYKPIAVIPIPTPHLPLPPFTTSKDTQTNVLFINNNFNSEDE